MNHLDSDNHEYCKLYKYKIQLLSPGTSVSSTTKTDRHDITEILLKVALNTITLTLTHLR